MQEVWCSQFLARGAAQVWPVNAANVAVVLDFTKLWNRYILEIDRDARFARVQRESFWTPYERAEMHQLILRRTLSKHNR